MNNAEITSFEANPKNIQHFRVHMAHLRLLDQETQDSESIAKATRSLVSAAAQYIEFPNCRAQLDLSEFEIAGLKKGRLVAQARSKIYRFVADYLVRFDKSGVVNSR